MSRGEVRRVSHTHLLRRQWGVLANRPGARPVCISDDFDDATWARRGLCAYHPSNVSGGISYFVVVPVLVEGDNLYWSADRAVDHDQLEDMISSGEVA